MIDQETLDKAVAEMSVAMLELMRLARETDEPLEGFKDALQVALKKELSGLFSAAWSQLDTGFDSLVERLAERVEQVPKISGAQMAEALRSTKGSLDLSRSPTG